MATSEQASLNELLKWSIENSEQTRSTNGPKDPNRGLNAEALQQLLGGPSDADRMRGAMAAIVASPDEVDLENKVIAWDNFEQLIEQIDNANNIDSLGLWPPLITQLNSSEPDNRKMAAWCISTAVQNNIKCQERFLATGAISKIVELATRDSSQAVRKKAISALSSESRNFQPGLDEALKHLPESSWGGNRRMDAADMEAVDELIQTLRSKAAAS